MPIPKFRATRRVRTSRALRANPVLRAAFSPRNFSGPSPAIPTIVERAFARARGDLSRLYVRHLKAQIRKSTTRRTGRLLRAMVLRHPQGRRTLTLLPNFPATEYFTPPGRGRPGASKRGQCAFVVNASRDFIAQANIAMQSDPMVSAILQKHMAFIIRQLELKP